MKIKPVNVSQLIKSRRIVKNWSQHDVSASIGYSSNQGQYISNVERMLCAFPVKKSVELCKALDIPADEFKAALVRDYEIALQTELAKHGVLV